MHWASVLQPWLAPTGQDFKPSSTGMNLLGATNFPQLDISSADPTLGGGLEFGPSLTFGNAGMYQNQWEFETSLNKVIGKHTISVGMQWGRTQLHINNDNTNTDNIYFIDS
jgi:hypothetical protein